MTRQRIPMPKVQDLASAPYWLYRCYDKTDQLVYVGISHDAHARLRGHSYRSWWAADVEYVELEEIQGKTAALEAEKVAVRTEHPRWNVQHRRGHLEGMPKERLADYMYALTKQSGGRDGWAYAAAAKYLVVAGAAA